MKRFVKKYDNFYPIMPVKFPHKKIDGKSEFFFDIYDCNNNKTDMSKLKSGMFSDVFLELSEVWIGSKEFGFPYLRHRPFCPRRRWR